MGYFDRVRLILILFFCLLARAGGQMAISEAVPARVYLETGGRQATVILKGEGLEAAETVACLYGGQPSEFILCRLSPAEGGQRGLILLASPEAPKDNRYRLLLVGGGQTVTVPVSVEMVEPGDKRATVSTPAASTVREAVQESRGSAVVVRRDAVPQVLSTVPSSLMVPPDGQSHRLVLRGERLNQITDVRVRKKDQPSKYRGKQGQLFFTCADPGELSVELRSAAGTPMGEEYCLDLMVERYLVATLPVVVGNPPPVQEPDVETKQEDAGSKVIEIPLSSQQSSPDAP